MKRLISTISEYVKVYRDNRTGIAWVENGSTGLSHSCHPNISATGSVRGMKSLGYWDNDDETVRSHGFIYNISRFTVEDDLDRIAALACRCGGRHG